MSYDDCCSPSPSDWWKEFVDRWSRLDPPQLREVVLDAAWACVQDGHCASLTFALTKILCYANIDTLTVKHLQDFCPDQKPDWSQTSTTFKKLNILMTTWTDEACPDHDIENLERHAFFNQRLNAVWLSHSQSRLTHLTLHCNTYWGVFPRWQPEGLHFPSLKSLALSKWTITFDWQLDFITSHGETLEQLILTDCPILYASRMMIHQSTNALHLRPRGTSRGKPPTANFFCEMRWHQTLPCFQEKLPKLKHFSMGRGPVNPAFCNRADLSADEAFDDRYSLIPRIDSSRYAIFDFGEGAISYETTRFHWHLEPDESGSTPSSLQRERCSWEERETDEDVKTKLAYPACLEEDEKALAELLSVIKERA